MINITHYSETIKKNYNNDSIASTLEKKLDTSNLAKLISKKMVEKGLGASSSTVLETFIPQQSIQQIMDKVEASHTQDFENTVCDYLQPLRK